MRVVGIDCSTKARGFYREVFVGKVYTRLQKIYSGKNWMLRLCSYGHFGFQKTFHILVEHQRLFSLIELHQRAVFACHCFQESFLVTLKTKDRKVCPKQNFVIDSGGNNTFYSRHHGIITQRTLVTADIEKYVRPEPAHHDALVDKVDRSMGQNKVHCWE